MAAHPEDLNVIERAGRRCSECHTGRNWRRFEVIRREGHEPVVQCGACAKRNAARPDAPAAAASAPATAPRRARAAAPTAPDAGVTPAAVSTPAGADSPAGDAAPAAGGLPDASGRPAGGRPASSRRPAGKAKTSQGQSEDRLRRVLRELPPGEYSTERLAKSAGLNSTKVLARLHALRDAGHVRQVGKQWSNVPAPTDLEAAFDRLQASTGNLRIIRERPRIS